MPLHFNIGRNSRTQSIFRRHLNL